MDRLCLIHEEFRLRYFNVAYITYFLMPIIFCRGYADNMADTFERTLDEFAKLLRTIFDEDDDAKGISSDNKSNLDS